MRDFPFFTTENGVASIYLNQVPYRGTAYIRIRSASDPEALLEECVGFCRAVEAKSVYAADHEILSGYPVHTSVIQMCCRKDSLPDTDAALFPVQKETLSQWRELYNMKMRDVDGASYMTILDGERLLKAGNGYFVHRGDVLLGIGIAAGERIDAVTACVPGAGRDVVLALAHAISGETVCLEVASTNTRAVRLYGCLGFIAAKEVICWYKIF